MGIDITSGSISFSGGIVLTLAVEILDYGLLTEGLTEGTEDYNLITQAVSATNDFGLIV